MASIRGLLIDLSGVVYQGAEALPGAIDAIEALKARGMPIRFITNTTSKPLSGLVQKLDSLGVPASADEIFTPAKAARAYIADNNLEPHFLMQPELREDFEGLESGTNKAVVVGDARDGFTFQALNEAFRHLDAGAVFLALAKNRVFVDDDGERSLDVGAFVAALEYASGREALVMGKPSAAFFRSALADMGVSPKDAAMIGDDAEFDVAAAREAGLEGFLVRTGKWKPGDADAAGLPAETEFDDLAAVVAHITGSSQ